MMRNIKLVHCPHCYSLTDVELPFLFFFSSSRLFLTPLSLTWLKVVYDKDTFSLDDKMGDAEFEIKTFVEVVRMRLEDPPEGTIVTRVKPSRDNCLSEESCIIWTNGKIVQNLFLRLRNVECGEVEIQLEWIDIHGSTAL